MNLSDIIHRRLINQQIAETKFSTAKELVHWMGAMQAQDYSMARWAIGSRLPISTDNQIAAALDEGRLIRTHLLRPTWHIVSAEDVYWILDLTASQVKASMKSRNKELELTDALFAKSNIVIEKALEGGKYLTRQEVMAELEQAGITTNNARAVHFMFQAELDGIVANGAMRGKQFTYALLEERVLKPKQLSREEALAKLAQMYFTSHGPATVKDFVWWSGLSATLAKQGLELIKPSLISEQVESQTYWFGNSFVTPESKHESVYLLPAFDEYIISYKDRSAVLSSVHHKKAIAENGLFNPAIVAGGQVIGIWKRTLKKDKALIETYFFQSPTDSTLHLLEKACLPFSRFLDKNIEIVHRLV